MEEELTVAKVGEVGRGHVDVGNARLVDALAVGSEGQQGLWVSVRHKIGIRQDEDSLGVRQEGETGLDSSMHLAV